MISFPCPHCHKPLRVKDELVGKQGKCPACGKPIAIPAASGSLAAAATDSGKRSPIPAANETRTTPPKAPAPEPPTLPPGQPLTGGPADSSGAETEGGGPNCLADVTANLTDFLAPPPQPDEIGRLGPYRVLAVLGHGGMGVVFRAEDPALQRPVALKAMLPALAPSGPAKERFLREARAAAAVKDDHVVAIYQVGEDCGAPFLAMEFLEGEPLDARLLREPKLPIAEVLRIGRETCLGLAAAHERGLVHRDVKPANLWIEKKRGRVKILDFGLARAVADATHLTQSGAIVGTPAYMAPEQARADGADHRADLFSVGCVLYRLAAGEQPFQGADTMALLVALALDTPRPLRELNPAVPPALADLVARLLAKQPDQRPASAEEVARELEAIEAQGVPAATRAEPRPGYPAPRDLNPTIALPPAGTAPVPSRPRRRALWVASVAIATLLLVGVVLLFRPGKSNPPRPDEPGRAAALPAEFKNSLGMEFVLVPKGQAWLGGGGGREGDKEVEMTQVFYLGKYEVTQEEWEKVMGFGQNPSSFSRAGRTIGLPIGGGDAVKHIPGEELQRFPAEQVSWEDAQKFLKALNEKAKETDWVYRLPKEVEWEYACRGGPMEGKSESTFDFYFEKPTNALLPEQANFEHGRGLKRTCKVGSYQPNRLGLYDMHGNVFEWCDDVEKAADGTSWRANRGGSWYYDASFCGAANRYTYRPSHLSLNVGLRLARVPVGEDGKELPIVTVSAAGVGRSPFPPLDEAWVKKVQALPAGEQVKEVAEELKRRNPGFDGKVEHEIQGGVVTLLDVRSNEVADISPVRGLSRLNGLAIMGVTPDKGKFVDVSPLRAMRLTVLKLSDTSVSDLSLLKGMPLWFFSCGGTDVADLSPLRGMPLTSLYCNKTRIVDLSPLKGTPLTLLNCQATQVTDLSPLRDMPLKELWCDFKPERDAAILRSIKTLEKIKGKSAAEFWKEQDAKKGKP